MKQAYIINSHNLTKETATNTSFLTTETATNTSFLILLDAIVPVATRIKCFYYLNGHSVSVKPVLTDHCFARPPVLKDHIFLVEVPIL